MLRVSGTAGPLERAEQFAVPTERKQANVQVVFEIVHVVGTDLRVSSAAHLQPPPHLLEQGDLRILHRMTEGGWLEQLPQLSTDLLGAAGRAKR